MTDCRLGGFESKILSRSVGRNEVPWPAHHGDRQYEMTGNTK